ncbi:LamG-like jellyroll fold domain-containing protein [Chondromyces apiculatus]|uniref:LamG-like jellyroll fold domain-containing protein n=1 Tax=Chondromyces apiculatus DSM 436 TaxID=1192034 RepID=A0A017T347_9BACT|nr:LamG-like jellyroll fold domain-containing protein [Chondromyces apiculatus]EYF03648.1 Hypothetical protein CAP_5259 [Chondromyces apiculatus DSM 436]
MSTITSGLTLHLKLDAVVARDGTRVVQDASTSGNHGTLQGSEVTLVHDATFGRCLQLGGKDGYVAVKDPFGSGNDFTLCLWLKPEAVGGDDTAQGVLGEKPSPVPAGLPGSHANLSAPGSMAPASASPGAMAPASASPGAMAPASASPGAVHPKATAGRNPSLERRGDALVYDAYDRAADASGGYASHRGTVSGFFQGDDWVHVTWVKQGESYRIYRDARPMTPDEEIPAPAAYFTAPGTDYAVGCAGACWAGRIAGVRIYDRALRLREIWQVIEADKVVPFREAHPVDFTLSDGNEAPVLYIEDSVASPEAVLNLELTNTSGRPIYVEALDGTAATDEAHHVALRFRKGVLAESKRNQQQVREADAWALGFGATRDADVLYLRWKTPGVLGAGDTLAVTLLDVAASALGGARGTRVALTTRHLSYEATGGGEIEETRTHALSIVNHSGQKAVPFRACTLGPNKILQGTKSTVTLLLTSALQRDVVLDPTSKLVLSAETEPDGAPGSRPWALARASELATMIVTVIGETWTITPETSGPSPTWTLQPQSRRNLSADAAIKIQLDAILSSLPLGMASITLRYENVPGYWDGSFSLPVEKSPMSFPCDAQGQSLGIGLRGFSFLVGPSGGTEALQITNSASADVLRVTREGILSTNAIDAKPMVSTFKLEGQADTFYPVFFDDPNGSDGPFELQIITMNVKEYAPFPSTGDPAETGWFISTFRGRGELFFDVELSWERWPSVANYGFDLSTSAVIVWLRGQTTYHWRSNQRVVAEPLTAQGLPGGRNGSLYSPMTKVDPKILKGKRLGEPLAPNYVSEWRTLDLSGSTPIRFDLGFVPVHVVVLCKIDGLPSFQVPPFVGGPVDSQGVPRGPLYLIADRYVWISAVPSVADDIRALLQHFPAISQAATKVAPQFKVLAWVAVDDVEV